MYMYIYTHTYTRGPQTWAASGCLYHHPRTGKTDTASTIRTNPSGPQKAGKPARCTFIWATKLRAHPAGGNFACIKRQIGDLV